MPDDQFMLQLAQRWRLRSELQWQAFCMDPLSRLFGVAHSGTDFRLIQTWMLIENILQQTPNLSGGILFYRMQGDIPCGQQALQTRIVRPRALGEDQIGMIDLGDSARIQA